MAEAKPILVCLQVAAVIVLVGSCVAVLGSLFSAPLLALPALILAWFSIGLYRLRLWAAVVVCALCWCAVGFLLLASALWGLADDHRYATAFAEPSFTVVFWSGLTFAILVTVLVSAAWRQLESGL
jgi:hypothetical protein